MTWKGNKIKYFFRKSLKAKRIKIEIKKNGKIFLVVPKFIPNFLGSSFLKNNIEKVLKKRNEVLGGFGKLSGGKDSSHPIKNLSKNDFQKYKKEAEEKITERVEFFAKKYGFQYNQIKIKDNKTNWGSCSIKKNLNFNYRLIFLKEDEMDYVIIHELCHLIEMNHSKRFWSEVEKKIPNYKELKKNIKNIY